MAVTLILAVNCAEITAGGPRKPALKISTLNVDFSSLSFDPLSSRSPPYGGIKFGYPNQDVLLLHIVH